MTILQSLAPDEKECFFPDSSYSVLVTIAIHTMSQQSDPISTHFSATGTRQVFAL